MIERAIKVDYLTFFNFKKFLFVTFFYNLIHPYFIVIQSYFYISFLVSSLQSMFVVAYKKPQIDIPKKEKKNQTQNDV